MNIDIVLFAGRIVLVALLYIFLFAVMKTGVGLVRGQRRDSAIWTIDVDKGPRGIRGIHVDMLGPVIVGRSPSSDICINEPFVSASHARFSLQGPALIIEDLNSLNGTLVNGRQLVEPATLREGDEVQIGDVVIEGLDLIFGKRHLTIFVNFHTLDFQDGIDFLIIFFHLF